MTQELSDYWRAVADHSLGGYAPRYDAMVRAAAGDPAVMALVAAAPPEAHAPNNLHAAARYLLLSGIDHPLSAAYAPDFEGDAGRLFCDLVRSYPTELGELLATRHVQTNEVNRTAAIAPLLNLLGHRSGASLALVDVGCSAGLNLLLDRYRIDIGDVALGPADARLRLAAESRGRPAMAEPSHIAWRRGIDRSPIDVTDADQARWLEALIWPDHPDRLERLRAAIAEVRADPPELVRADAIEGLRVALDDAPAGLLVVALTSWVAFYFENELRRAFEATVLEADRPVAWLAMEMEGVVRDVEVPPDPGDGTERSVLTLVAGGGGRPATREFLGFTHPHGNWVDLA